MISNNNSKTTANISEGNTSIEATVPKNFVEKLKIKWGLESIFQVIIVLLVFSITGTSVVFLRKTFFGWLGFDENTNFWLKTVTYILFMLPAYQTLLLFYGSLFGQFEFFWNKEKKLFYAIKRLFVR